MARALWLVLCGAGVWGCAAGGTQDAPTPARSERSEVMSPGRVSVDMFSGREPPAWALTTDEAQAARELVKSLPVGTHRIPDVGLGYRGFDVAWADGAHAKVYRDVVVLSQGERTVLYQDAGRKMEQWLLTGARSHLAPELFVALESQVQSP
ncbi:hypothetical protein KRR26_14090 [Corallococcus sp. M34]|uniref:hypothetical protein n=1 Tax=Citreicoccus inhibens TaxID=2849499 RepID=UPI001C220499|nr:hypothetical protein [Citreicoccus inhibens]MBU8896744.1 hypothetical protein [Citreicoccus inhibens]